MRRIIPASLMSVCAEIAAKRETHATLDSLFTYAGAVGDPPSGSKPAKALEWLRITNKSPDADALGIVARVIENYMEMPLDPENHYHQEMLSDRDRIQKVLVQNELQYLRGGQIIGALGTPSRTLEEFIKDRDAASIDREFDRALKNVDTNPREAVSAASNILESICKVYIEEEGLGLPARQDLKPIWTIVRKHLGFDPSAVEDQDLQQILSGLISIVEGTGALRTHASSAHGAGKRGYKLEPRHSRLAIHSAHTVALFILETWRKKSSAV